MAALRAELPVGVVEGSDSDELEGSKSAPKKPKIEEEEENVVDESDENIKDPDGDGEGDGDDGGDYVSGCEEDSDFEFYQYSSDTNFEDEETRRKANEELKNQFYLHHKQVKKSGGFDVDIFPNVPRFGGIHPLNVDNEDSSDNKLARKCLTVAIKKHNKKEKEKLKLVKVLKANVGSASGRAYYITFDARDIRDRSKLVKTYQCKAIYGIREPNDKFGIHIDFLRPKAEENVRCKR